MHAAKALRQLLCKRYSNSSVLYGFIINKTIDSQILHWRGSDVYMRLCFSVNAVFDSSNHYFIEYNILPQYSLCLFSVFHVEHQETCWYSI